MTIASQDLPLIISFLVQNLRSETHNDDMYYLKLPNWTLRKLQNMMMGDSLQSMIPS